MRRLGLLGGAAALMLAACQTPETGQGGMQKESDAFKQAIAGVTRRWEGWVTSGQADSIAAIFAEQGREMPPNEPAVVGRAAIRRYEAQNAATFDGKLTITNEVAMASGPLGVDRGSYAFEGKAKKGAPKGTPAMVRDEGKYLAHWHSINGQWMVVDLIWNANRPMMTPSAAMKGKPSAPAMKKAPAKKK